MALSASGLLAESNKMQAILPAGMGCLFLHDAEAAGTYWNAPSVSECFRVGVWTDFVLNTTSLVKYNSRR